MCERDVRNVGIDILIGDEGLYILKKSGRIVCFGGREERENGREQCAVSYSEIMEKFSVEKEDIEGQGKYDIRGGDLQIHAESPSTSLNDIAMAFIKYLDDKGVTIFNISCRLL